MKNLLSLCCKIFLLVLLAAFYSCQDEFTEKDAIILADSLSNGSIEDIRYSVSVVPVSNTAFLKSTTTLSASPAGAIVTVSQNSIVVTDSVDDRGIAVFDNMKPGNASVVVSLSGYSTVMYVADLTSAGGAATLIPMFPLSEAMMAKVEGKATIQTNLINSTEEFPVGAKIAALLDVSDPSFSTFYKNLGGDTSQFSSGRIIKMAFTDAVYTSTIGADGSYSLFVPASGVPGVPIKIVASDFFADQTLLLDTKNGEKVFGEQQIPTIWGENFTPSSIPSVPSAYVILTEPVGAISLITTNASALAYIDNTNSISSINITSSGTDYADPQTGYYTCGIFDPSAPSATGEARIYIENGRVTRTFVNDGGFGFTSSAKLNLERVVVPFSGTLQVSGGAIIGVNISNNGEYRIIPTTAQISPGAGSGGRLQPIWNWNGSAWQVAGFNILSSGSGYTNGRAVTIIATGTDASSTVNLSSGSLTSMAVTNAGAGYYIAPEVIITGGGGSGAVATASIDQNTHKLDYITVVNSGSGYTSAPNVQLVVKNVKYQGKINLNINSQGVVTNASVLDGGQGYFTVPTLTVIPSVNALGSGAQLIATIDQSNGTISSVRVLEGGSNYLGKNNPTSTVSSNLPYRFNAISGKSNYFTLKFGTGNRSIVN